MSSPHRIMTGPRGGKYYLDKNGRKRYLASQLSPARMSPKASPARKSPKASPVRMSPKAFSGKRRGSATKGWKEDAPKKGYERHMLKKKCGDECFMLPQEEKFPICPKLGIGKDCQIDSRALTAAKIRAKQHGYDQVYERVQRMQNLM